VSCNPIKDATTELIWLYSDDANGNPTANVYRDKLAGRNAWLCGLAQVLLGDVHPRLWLTLKPHRGIRERVRDLVLPFENPDHPLHYNKAVEEEFDDLFCDHLP
jgi:hypothetical protein